MQYPIARRDSVVDDYHGVPVADPYRWLEDPGSPDTVAWSEAQNELTRQYLDSFPARERIVRRVTALTDYPKHGLPVRKGDRYFMTYNPGLENQPTLYRMERPGGPRAVVLDPNDFSSDGTVAIEGLFYSEDGALAAYSVSAAGSDWQTIRVRDVDTGADHPESIGWCRFTNVAWRKDNSGFYYSRYPDPTGRPEAEQVTDMKVYWHALGTAQEDDRLVYERPDASELGFLPDVTKDGRYLVLHVWHGTDRRNRFYYREEGTGQEEFARLLDEQDAGYDFLGNDGTLFYFKTDLDAPRGRIVAIDVTRPDRACWRELVAEQDAVLSAATMVNDQFVLVYERDAHHQVQVHDLDGAVSHAVELGTFGSITGLAGDREDRELFLGFTSFLRPPSVYRYDFPTRTLSLLYGASVDLDPERYQTRQVFYRSKDGTRVPMFVTHRKGLDLDGRNPTILYGYGGFKISLLPAYSELIAYWAEHGGVYAVANLRGGNEYGEQWHEAAMLERKQNVFDDFIAAAEWLVASGYTSPSRLASYGGSNGGLLVSACMLQRPELFGAVLCAVPVTDMLRFHRFTVGRYWVVEYGNAETSPEHFRFLLAYSPLHNVKEGVAYPPTLILTADTDDRVVPAHAKKFAATLQAASGGDAPILLRLEPRAGHGHGKPVYKRRDEICDCLVFLDKVLGTDDSPAGPQRAVQPPSTVQDAR
jgi:prolyl oligopeptidase